MDSSLCGLPKLVLKSGLAPLILAHNVEKLEEEYGVPALVKTLASSAF